MDLQTQLSGLEHFFVSVYGTGTSLPGLLTSLGFDSTQVKSLQERHLPALAAGLVQAIHDYLTWEDKDTWFRLISRRFGLDGEPPVPSEAAARALGLDPAYAARASTEALEKCRTRTAQENFKKDLRRLALSELAGSGEKPAREAVVTKLRRLADLRAAADVARIDYEAKRAEVMKQVQAELDALDLEFRPVLDAAEDNADTLEAEIKNDVMLRGESLRGGAYQAVYMKGRVSYDAHGVDEYARTHPELLKYRREGQPSVSLRTASESSKNESD